MAAPACERCGSKDLRRKRPRGPWARAYRAVTGRHRYACNACHHRGWTRGVLHSGAPAPGQEVPTPPPGRTAQQYGRPLEHRDLVAERQRRVARTIGVVVAVVLGALLAVFIGWAVH